MEITEELLETIFKRAKQFAINNWGSEPDYFKSYGEGDLYAVWTSYCCGGNEENSELITAENLTQDLDKVAEERLKRLEEQRIKDEAERKKREEERKTRDKESRKQEYLKLKQEFE